jgi:hypothetical protein
MASEESEIIRFKLRWSECGSTALYKSLRASFPSLSIEELVDIGLMTAGSKRAERMFQSKVNGYDENIASMEKKLKEAKEDEQEAVLEASAAKRKIRTLEEELLEMKKAAENKEYVTCR